MNKKYILFLKPPSNTKAKNVVRDFVYGCWCNGRRIGGMQMPPLNELYAVTYLRRAGLNAFFLDAQSEPNYYEKLLKNGYEGVCAVAIMSSTQSFNDDVKIFERIKELNKEIRTIVFGSHPTFMPNYCLQKEAIDYIVMREPEETLLNLFQAISNCEGIENIEGIGFRSQSNEIIVNPCRPFIDMDTLPIPDRSFLPERVDYFNPVVKKMPYTTMQTSRGCPGRCIFCTVPSFYGKKYRFRSVDSVLDEMRYLKRSGYNEIFFRDETFTFFKKRNIEICESILKENMNILWIANTRVDMIDRDTMKLMKKAGCHMLKFGVETGNDDILLNYKKGITCSQTEEVFRSARETGLDTHAHIVFGGPGETPETIKRTIRFVNKIKPTTVTFGILTPYPGTELFQTVAQQHPEIKDGTDSNMDDLHVKGFFSESICGMSSLDLSNAVVEAYRSFYIRPTYLLERLLKIRSLEELVILTTAGFNVLQFSITGEK